MLGVGEVEGKLEDVDGGGLVQGRGVVVVVVVVGASGGSFRRAGLFPGGGVAAFMAEALR